MFPVIEATPSLAEAVTNGYDVANLLPQLLDQLVVLGDLARQISQSLGSNGHRPEAAEKLIGELIAGRPKFKTTLTISRAESKAGLS